MTNITVGVDVGGTNVKLGLIDAQGCVVARSRLVTKSYISKPIQLIAAIADAILALLKSYRFNSKNIKGVGIGLPGLVDPSSGLVIFLPNIPGWRNIALGPHLQKALKVPIFLDNDVNVITLGEWRYGAGVGSDNMIGMTLGTGVGAGLILNGSLYRGPGFAAGELGHIPISLKGGKCNCPSFACLETYVGSKHLKTRAVKIFRRKNIELEDVFELAKQGNKRAIKFWEESGGFIGGALVGVVNLLNPTKIVIGGGISNNARFLFPEIRRHIKQRAMPVQAKMAKVVRASLGDDAGLIGASVLVETEKSKL